MNERFCTQTSIPHPTDLPMMYTRSSFNDVIAFNAPLDNQLPFSTPPHTPTNVALTSNQVGVVHLGNLNFGGDTASASAACINLNTMQPGSYPNMIPASAVSYPMMKAYEGPGRLQHSLVPCAQCGQLFSDRFAHRAHVRTVHNVSDEHLPGQVLTQLTIQQPAIPQIEQARRASIVHPGHALSPTTPLDFATNHIQFQSSAPQSVPAPVSVAFPLFANNMLPATVDSQSQIYTSAPMEQAQPLPHLDLQTTSSPGDFQMFPYSFPSFETVKTPLVPSHHSMLGGFPTTMELSHQPYAQPVSDLTVPQVVSSGLDIGAFPVFEPELTNSPAPSMTSVSTGLNDLLWSEDIGLGMLRPIEEEEDAPSSPPEFNPCSDDDSLSDFCSSFPLPEFTELTPQSDLDNSSTPSPSIVSDPFTFTIDVPSHSSTEELPRLPAQFPCRQCLLNFPKHSHLKRHIRHAHATISVSPQNVTPPPASKRRNSDARKLPKVIAEALAQGLPKPRFPCANCERTFSRSDALARHVRTKGCYGPGGPPVGRKSSVASINSHSAVAVE
ncbi:hypothetical protein BJ742DRAFT_258250 [Cladochytrium replicatum]|nr:hypothetical protein BJ742DRAFT_258250 [Cladochytrium replicatum]